MTESFILLHFPHDFSRLLRQPVNNDGLITYPLTRRASIKDIIEALGIPHTEVGRIVEDGRECDFNVVPVGGEFFSIYPTSPNLPVTEPSVLRPIPLPDIQFSVDNNVRKLARLLRMTGYDAEDVPDLPLREAAQEVAAANRILLTRNHDILKVREVTFGHLLRSQNPEQQFREVTSLYRLTPNKAPFSRCLECNGILVTVNKEDILDQLEPLTKKYYTHFKQCRDCNLLFWRGSHHEKMKNLMTRLTLNSDAAPKQSD